MEVGVRLLGIENPLNIERKKGKIYQCARGSLHAYDIVAKSGKGKVKNTLNMSRLSQD